MGKTKGYKLTSSSGDGPKVCAFFFSEQGCRNGSNCKPETIPSSTASVSSSSVVSSESESEGEIDEIKAGPTASLTRV
ncbi:hypothetical protein THAOC_22412, partial [Thalassiosira oceanica]